MAPFFGGKISLLSISGLLFLSTSLLPILTTGKRWFHPLVIQIPILSVQAISIIAAGCGLIALQNPFLSITSDIAIEDLYINTSLINAVGCLVMFLACFWPRSVKRLDSVTCPKYTLNRRLVLFACIFTLIAWSSYLYIVYEIGSIGFMFSNMGNRVIIYHDLNYFIKFTKVGIYAAILLLFNRNIFISMLLVVGQIFIATSLGDRGDVIFYTLIPYIITWHFIKQPIAYKHLLLVFIIFISFYVALGNYRTASIHSDNTFNTDINISQILSGVMHHHNTAAVVYKVDKEEIPLQLGSPLMNVFYAPIPRAVWPKKPIIAESALVGSWLKKSDILSGLPPGLFGYGYLNFGWIGVVLFAGITGIVISRFYFWCIARYTSNGKKVPNGSVLIYSLFYFLITNPISTEVQVSILIQVPFLLLIFFNCRSNSKS